MQLDLTTALPSHFPHLPVAVIPDMPAQNALEQAGPGLNEMPFLMLS